MTIKLHKGCKRISTLLTIVKLLASVARKEKKEINQNEKKAKKRSRDIKNCAINKIFALLVYTFLRAYVFTIECCYYRSRTVMC